MREIRSSGGEPKSSLVNWTNGIPPVTSRELATPERRRRATEGGADDKDEVVE